MRFSRSVVLAAVALVIAGLSGAATLIARADAASLPTLPGKPGTPPLLAAKQVRIPDCANQDRDDDDDDKAEIKNGKPDTDDIELQCGDDDDDDGEIEDHDAPGKHHEREKSHEKHAATHVAVSKKVSGK